MEWESVADPGDPAGAERMGTVPPAGVQEAESTLAFWAMPPEASRNINAFCIMIKALS